MAVGGPQLELGVAGGAQAGQVVVAAGVEVDAREGLCVAAIQPLGESNHGRQPLDGLAQRALELAVAVM